MAVESSANPKRQNLPALKQNTNPCLTPTPKLRPNQEAQFNCRNIAEEEWKKNPQMTITAMARQVRTLIGSADKMYTERTTYEWIKDLKPGPRKGGRPPKKKPPV